MKILKRITIFSMALMLCIQTMSIPVFAAAAGGIFPYQFGFGTQGGDNGRQSMLDTTGMQLLSFTDSKGITLTYYAYVPKDMKGQAIENLPLLLFMHGYTDGGNNASAVVSYHNGIVFQLLKDREKVERQSVILIPMTRKTASNNQQSRWVDIGYDTWSRGSWNMDATPRTENLNAVVELTKKYQKDVKANVDRTYVTGMSMGGYATWDLISRDDSHMFAAAAPICGVGDPLKVNNIKDLPIHTFHGTIDPVITVDSTRTMYKTLRSYGNVTYKEYPDEQHASWNAAYSNVLDDDGNGKSNVDDLIDWMFNQTRNGPFDGRADRKPLEQMITEARKVQEINYLNKDWTNLQNQISQAENLLKDDKSSNEEIKKVCTKLALLMDAVKLEENTDLAIVSVSSGSETEGPASQIIDNNESTIWQTNYGDATSTTNNDKHWLLFDLGSSKEVSGLKYLPRQNFGNFEWTGTIYDYRIYAGDDKDDLVEVASGTWSKTKDWKTVVFDQQIKAQYVKLKSERSEKGINNLYMSSGAELRITQPIVKVLVNKEQTIYLVEQANNLVATDYETTGFKAMKAILEKTNDFITLDIPDGSTYTMYYMNLDIVVKSLVPLSITETHKDLSDIINTAKAIEKDRYTDESWGKLQSTLKDASSLLDTAILRSQLTNGIDLVKKAIIELKLITDNVDRLLLQKAVHDANEVTERELDKVIPIVVNEFREALKEANRLLADKNTTQKELNKSLDWLSTVIQKLSSHKGNKEELISLVKKIENINRDDFINETLESLDIGIIKAKKTISNENATESEVKQIMDSLATAFLQLKLNPNKTLLEELINKTEKLDANLYTKDSFTIVKTALISAKRAFNKDDIIQESVNEAVKVLESAINGLKVISSENIVKTGDDCVFGMFLGLFIMSGIIMVLNKRNNKER